MNSKKQSSRDEKFDWRSNSLDHAAGNEFLKFQERDWAQLTTVSVSESPTSKRFLSVLIEPNDTSERYSSAYVPLGVVIELLTDAGYRVERE